MVIGRYTLCAKFRCVLYKPITTLYQWRKYSKLLEVFYPIKKSLDISQYIAVYRCLLQLIAVMSSQGCREIAVKATVANATRIQLLSAVACCVRVVMSRLLTTVSDDFPTVALRFFFNRVVMWLAH